MSSILAFFSLLAAYMTQEIWSMQPCAWCILIRIILVIVFLLSVLNMITGTYTAKQKTISGLIIVASLAGLMVNYQIHSAVSSMQSCGMSLAQEIINTINTKTVIGFFQPTGQCSDNYRLFGIPYYLYSTGVFLAIMASEITNIKNAGFRNFLTGIKRKMKNG